MRCTKQTVQQIVDSGNDYLIAVKGNQPNLYQELNTQFEQAVEMAPDIQTDSSHGRQVQRSWYSTDYRDECLSERGLSLYYQRNQVSCS